MSARSTLRSAHTLLCSAPLSSRSLHTASALFSSAPSTSSASSAPTASPSAPTLLTSLILSRPPTILRQPTSFESAYFSYNRQLSEALQQPFPKDFYFKKGSAAEKRFDEHQAVTPHGFEPEPKKVKGKQSNLPSQTTAMANEGIAEGEAENMPLGRETEADEKGDVRCLWRKLDRTLYLVVKEKKANRWEFPHRKLDRQAKENLHVSAPLAVTRPLGRNMDIWMITNSPVGLYRPSATEKTYFMRAHILAGQPSLQPSEEAVEGEVEDFQWLTSDEIKNLMKEDTQYWEAVEELLDP
ncbi:hypothetical protein ACQY0O_004741 [Thecaphora frezii]